MSGTQGVLIQFSYSIAVASLFLFWYADLRFYASSAPLRKTMSDPPSTPATADEAPNAGTSPAFNPSSPFELPVAPLLGGSCPHSSAQKET